MFLLLNNLVKTLAKKGLNHMKSLNMCDKSLDLIILCVMPRKKILKNLC